MAANELKFVVFHVKHLELAELDLREFAGVGVSQDVFERIEGMASIGVAMTIMYDGRVIGFTGYFQLFPGVAEVWLIPTKYVGAKPLLLIKALLGYIEGIVKNHKLHRIQTTAIDDKRHNRFFEILGFTCEGVARDYSSKGVNHKYWARYFK